MSFLATQFQILSDLHLETPISKPQYDSFNFTAHANNVLLLGDIGLVNNEGLFVFLRRTLDRNRGTRILYVLGNHEAYQTTLEDAVQKLRAFEEETKSQYGGRFKFLHRDRYDIGDDVTVLGCPLWSAVQPEQAANVYARLTDFNEERGIREWTPEKLSEQHMEDREWLNAQVAEIEKDEPQRQIVIVTHHCPTIDPLATDPAHQGSSVSSGFTTDLSKETCWTSPVVKMWAFGHTHYSCDFRDETTGKLILSNQKGYRGLGQTKGSSKGFSTKIVEANKGGWQIVDAPPSTRNPEKPAKPLEDQESDMQAETSPGTQEQRAESREPTHHSRMATRARAFFRVPSSLRN
jgi:hypothetical protein